MGTLNIHYPRFRGGVSLDCSVRLTFDDFTSGSQTDSCANEEGSGRWRIQAIPGT